nr:immunoglobulin heavy chain junction region [Macaca mulatta]MOV40866.1 immunoglobulin heavy chain junction region [Macaca mulatta]MOV47329.1 immunoglobulin heavy chain junction region [Macaca mulatta]
CARDGGPLVGATDLDYW